MVSDSLSKRDGELTAKDGTDFAMMRETVEVAVETAFEVGVSQMTEQDIGFRCKVIQVEQPVNGLPC
jgi:hypothetical protein